jgi:hypothetical protein
MPTALRPAAAQRLFNHLAALSLTALALLASASAWADPPGRVGRIAEFVGAVWSFDPEQGEWTAAVRNRPLTSGDRLSVERDARAVLQIGSTTVRLDGDTELEVTELDDDHVRLHLHHGSLALRLRSNESVREFEVTTSEGRFAPMATGHYRIDKQDNASFGAVIAGALRLEARDSALDIHAGQRAEFWVDRGVTHFSWAAPANDRFSDWIAQQDHQDQRAANYRAYVSPEMTGAEDLDRYGDWDRHPEYGSLWLPRRIEPGWAPYRYGHWAYVRPWGWTWVDDAPWGFAPFHYGRWISWRGRWAWAPGQYIARPVYAPALVAWIGGPNVSIGINIGGGPSVGWVALSPREIYRPTYNVTNIYITNVNSPHRRWHPPTPPHQPVRTGPVMYTNQGVPGGVTVVPQNVLRERKPISNAVIAPVDPSTMLGGLIQPTQPGKPGQRGDDRHKQMIVAVAPPPAPVPRVASATGGGTPGAPAAPGAARATPWGQVAPAPRATVQPAPVARSDAAAPPPGALSNQAQTIERGVIAPGVPAANARSQRDVQEPRPQGQQNARSDPRRVAPAQAVQPAQPGQPVQAAPTARPEQGVRAAPPAPAAVQLPAQPGQPAREEPGRGRGSKDADERDDRQPPSQERRRDPRQQQNQ